MNSSLDHLNARVVHLRGEAFDGLTRLGYSRQNIARMEKGKGPLPEAPMEGVEPLGDQARAQRRAFHLLHILFYLREFDRAWKAKDFAGAALAYGSANTELVKAAATERDLEKRVGAWKTASAKARTRDEILVPLIRSIWSGLKPAERTPAGVQFELARQGIKRSETAVRQYLAQLGLA